MKKRFFAMLLCIIAVMTLCVFPVTVSAEEVSTETSETVETETPTVDEPVVETPAPEPETPLPEAPEEPEGEGVYHSVFTRIWEYVVENKTELLGILGDGVILVLAFLVKMGADKKNKRIADAIADVQKTTGLNLSNQQDVVTVVNGMIESYNKLEAEYKAFKESYDKYGQTEIDRNKVIGALTAEVSTVLDILSTVYVNNKNLPQGIKDLVNIKYANCLKALEKDGELASVVKAVRAAIGTGEDAGSTEEKVVPEDTEV